MKVEVFNKQLHILLNEHYPFLAFASFIGFETINFIDEPEVSKEFSLFYRVLGMRELNEPLYTKEGIEKIVVKHELNSAEWEQMVLEAGKNRRSNL